MKVFVRPSIRDLTQPKKMKIAQDQSRLSFRVFFRVWTLYGSMFAGAVGSALLIGGTAVLSALEFLRSSVPGLDAVFRGDGIFSSFEKLMSNGLEYLLMLLTMLFIVWILLALSALLPATIVGLVYEVLTRYLSSEKIVVTVTYALAAMFSTVYGVAAMSWQYDGMPFLYVPLALATGFVACKLTLRFRSDALEPKTAEDAAIVE